MQRERYKLIYEFYKYHIFFGHFQQGSQLPTIYQISDALFQVAPQTVHNALMKLQDDGLISVSPGRNTIVVYESTPEEDLRFSQDYYLARKDAIQQIYHISDLLLTPFFQEGCHRLTDDDLHEILCISKQKDANITSISIFCCNIMLEAMKNQLAKDLFFDIISFVQFPYISSAKEDNNEEYQQYYRLLLSSCEALDRDGVFCAFTGFQELTQKTLKGFIRKTSVERNHILAQIPFQWQTYRDRPQNCHTLAADILCLIIEGRYHEKDMLPSYENMANEFCVSVSTARRTVGMLRDMGIIHSINGVGNQILFTVPDWEKLRRPAIQKNITMAGESIEIILAAAEHVITKELSKLMEDQIKGLKDILAEKKKSYPLEAVFLIIKYAASIHPSEAGVEIYSRLLEFLILVYPFMLNWWKEDKKVSGFIEMMESALDTKNADQFTKGFIGLIRYVQADIGRSAHILQKQ